MTNALHQRVGTAVSMERLRPFLRAAKGDLSGALRLYAWNIEISGAFHGPLHCLEVILRNAMDRELTRLFSRPDWWNAPKLKLAPAGQEALRRARVTIMQDQPNPTLGHMIAELPFGFWTSLLGTGNRYDMRLWRPALHRAFPGYQGPRRALHQDLYHLRNLRNRIAHYEPIHHRHLAADHATIITVLDHISPDTADWVRENDRVPESLARRTDVCAALVPTRF